MCVGLCVIQYIGVCGRDGVGVCAVGVCSVPVWCEGVIEVVVEVVSSVCLPVSRSTSPPLPSAPMVSPCLYSYL